MIEKGAKDLDELEELERREATEAAKAASAVSELTAPVSPFLVDWSSVDWSVLLSEPPAPSSGFGTGVEVSGSS